MSNAGPPQGARPPEREAQSARPGSGRRAAPIAAEPACASTPLRVPTGAEVDAYRRDGFVVLRGVLAPSALVLLAPACERLLLAPDALDITEETLRLAPPHSPDALFGAPSYARVLAARGRFRMVFNSARREPAVLAFALAGAVGALVASLMRTRTVRFVDDILFVKDPGTVEATEWHDDDGGSVCTGDQRCSVWVSLADVPAAAGPLWMLRGSHRRCAGWRARGERAADHVAARPQDLVTCPLSVGDVVVHDLDTIHAAGPNASAQARRAWALRYAGDDARFVLRPARREPRAYYGLADGAPLTDARFPIAWPPATQREAQ